MKRVLAYAPSARVLYAVCAVLFVQGLLAHAYTQAPQLPMPVAPTLSRQAALNALQAMAATTSVPAAEPQYIEVTDSCGIHYEGACVTVRSGPGLSYDKVLSLRTGVVLKVVGSTEADGHTWYKIGFDEAVRYPERVTSDWYVAADYARLFSDPGELESTAGINKASTKRIVVDRSEQMLYAYDGDTLFMKQAISTGLELTPTPRGQFWIYKKVPARYMQGPLPGISDQYYDLPGVPWDLYFTYQGGALHGAYWHNNFGEPWSHGCVNLPPDKAHELYDWADLGTPVLVQD